MPEITGFLPGGSTYRFRVKREELKTGYTIIYQTIFDPMPLRGLILHIGLGQASRNAVWVRCLDGKQKDSVECVMISDILGYERSER